MYVADGEVVHAVAFVVVIHPRWHQVLVGRIGIYGDVAEVDVVDAVAWCAVVLRAEEYAQVEDAALLHALDAKTVEAYVADDVLVAALDSQQALLAPVEDVAVVDAHTAEYLALRRAVVAVGAYVDGVCHVGPEDAAADVEVLRAAPVPPAVVVERYAVVAGAQEAVLHPYVAAAHEVDAVGPGTGREGLQVADGDVLALPSEDGVMGGIEHCDAID